MSGTSSPKQQDAVAGTSQQRSKRSLDFDYWASRKGPVEPDPKKGRPGNAEPSQPLQIVDLVKGEYHTSKIHCRVTLKKITEKISEDGVKRTLNIHLKDSSGEIAAVAFSQYAEKLIDAIQMNHCYDITNFVVIQEDVKYPSYTGHIYKVRLTENSTVAQLEDQDSIPTIDFDFMNIDSVPITDDKERRDFLAVCVKNWGLQSNQTGGVTRYLTIFDRSKKSIRVTLWNNAAEEFGEEENVLVAFRKAVVSTFEGTKFLDTRGYSLIWKNPQLDDSGLLDWFKSLD